MTAPRSWREFAASAPLPARAGLVLVALLACALAIKLWPEWTRDPNLSHGFFAPVASLLLLSESRRSGPWRWLGPSTALTLCAGFALAGVGALAAAGLFAAALDWWNSIVDFTLAGSCALLGVSAIAALASERIRLFPWNWPSLFAALLWPLAGPMPPGTASRLALALQLWISEAVLRSLHFLGIAAHRDGNIIDLAAGSVGVEEACSGVRSLVSCVFVGFLFSAMLSRRPWARALLIGLAAPLALAANFARSLFLTLLVNRGIRIEGTWHDGTGYAVLGLTVAALGVLGLALKDPAASHRCAEDGAPAAGGPQAAPAISGDGASRALLAGAGLSIALLFLFWSKTRPATHGPAPVPDLSQLMPEAPRGWRILAPEDLYRFQDVLRTDHLIERTYVRRSPTGSEEVTLYAAYWRPGQASVTLVATHTPDACWPGAGWMAHPEASGPARLTVNGRPLAPGEHRVFTHGSFAEHVWFWHLYDGQAVRYENPRSAAALLAAAWKYGFRKEGDQLFVRVSSNRTWTDLELEPVIRAFFANTRNLGL